MDLYNLNVKTNNIGGYFSSEQLNLLSIIQCQTYEELISFISECEQLNGVFSKEDLQNFINQDLEQLKRKIFEEYQNTLVPHNSSKQVILDNTLHHLNLKQEDIAFIKKFYTDKNTENINIQITEFDLSLSESETLKTIGNSPEISYEEIYSMKREKINRISYIINNSGVRLNGITYWSLTDNIDCNLERIRTALLNKGIINDINQVSTVFGGLISTSSQ